MNITNIHEAWGSIVELEDPLDFFKYPKGYWRDLIYKRKLLVFKKMTFSLSDYGRFSFQFGRPWEYLEYFASKEEPVKVVDGEFEYNFSVFYNGIHQSNNGMKIDVEMDWHADLPNYGRNSFPFRALWAAKKPQNSSGNTLWLNIENCFDILNPRLQELAKRITVLQQNWHKAGGDEELCNLIKIHPITNEKSLRLNFYATPRERNAWIIKVFVDGVLLPDCSLIQEYIDDLMQHKQLFYAHDWEIGDIAIYDNHSFLHSRAPVYLEDTLESNERRFYRTNIDHMSDYTFQKIEFASAKPTSTIK